MSLQFMTTPFEERRRAVLEQLGEATQLVLFAAPVALRNNDVEHEYRQDSDFFYLTGCVEPDCVLVLGGKKREAVLFLRPRDAEKETWDGRRLGVDGAKNKLGMSAAFPIGELDTELPKLLVGMQRVACFFGRREADDARLFRAIRRARARDREGLDWPTELLDAATILHERRLFKEPSELQTMRNAAAITADGFARIMAAAGPGVGEFELEALLREAFRRGGAQRVAYSPIVGAGENACILHYRENERRMESGELVLVDAGCELDFYASDVTRTFPVDGRFSAPQAELYDLVLEAQHASLAAVRPGATLDEVHWAGTRVLVNGLIRLGLIKGPFERALEEKSYKKYYMHRTSHWLGMDVHDVGRYQVGGNPRPLEPGMVLTVEPGLYVAADAEVDERYRKLGIRIEDDVLVTAEGYEVLTAAIPKERADVERACGAVR